MNYQEYLRCVSATFKGNSVINADSLSCYEEVFKWRWIATKLKISSFVNYIPAVELETIKNYSGNCMKQALKQKKGLPRGFQNGAVSYSVLATDHVSPEAVQFVTARPDKHYSAFEMPAIFDLSTGRLFYYTGDIVWGMIYSQFLKDYLLAHFDPAK